MKKTYKISAIPSFRYEIDVPIGLSSLFNYKCKADIYIHGKWAIWDNIFYKEEPEILDSIDKFFRFLNHPHCDKSIKEKSLLMLPLNDIVSFSKDIKGTSNLSEDQTLSLINHLITYRRFIETYIIGQLILDSDTKRFIRNEKNAESLDYSILYVSTLMGFTKEVATCTD